MQKREAERGEQSPRRRKAEDCAGFACPPFPPENPFPLLSPLCRLHFSERKSSLSVPRLPSSRDCLSPLPIRSRNAPDNTTSLHFHSGNAPSPVLLKASCILSFSRALPSPECLSVHLPRAPLPLRFSSSIPLRERAPHLREKGPLSPLLPSEEVPRKDSLLRFSS